MARLNEPPAAPAATVVAAAPPQPGSESVDALIQQKPPADFEEVKRRFIRQNRELAKNNSSQSLRIRGLELEVSRLLADNLELRNQVLHLQNQVCTAESRAAGDAARKVKEQLQVKLTELSGIVDGIGVEQDEGQDVVKERKPLEGNWRERQPLTELMRDSQMPTIMEDKRYPRRTLGASEIQAIRLSDQSSNESPDLGPPPVAHFDYEDPVKTASPLVSKISPPSKDTATCEEDVLPAGLSVNLETRRKRRDGQSRLAITRHSLLPQEEAKVEGESSILRTGAKRKLADRESEKPIKPPSKGDFTFNRKTATKEAKAIEKEGQRSVEEAERIEVASPKPIRKVLGDKSVNVSPRKAATNSDKPEKDASEKLLPPRFTSGKEAGSTRRRRISAIPVPSPPHEAIKTIESPPPDPETQPAPAPKTPADFDLFSPTPSEPSAQPEGGRGDTPPPSDLNSLSSAAATEDAFRPSSRRARSAVNYAEPSLISKMRRPDKKMVDALTGLQDPRRARSGSEADACVSILIKQEPVDDEEWKALPLAAATSPLHYQKGGSFGTTTRPEHGIITSPEPPAEGRLPSASASSATISALMAGSRNKRRHSGQQQQQPQPPLGTDVKINMNVDATAKALEELDLYDFKESSSPLADGGSGGSGNIKKSDRGATRGNHRRHSSVPKEVGVRPPVERETGAVGMGMGMDAGRTERVGSRRRSMML